jgi:NAD(P)-dependent dehydrogenase (short-subunit alcohol dehydrogenase family)
MPEKQRTAIVTGGNRGIGYETCRQLAQRGYRVVLTSRDAAKGAHAANALRQAGADIVYHPLDVTQDESIMQLGDFVTREFGAADVLINNAALYLDEGRRVLAVEPQVFRVTMETNVYGPLKLSQTFIPLMLKQNYGRVVNVSSGMGQLSDMGSDTPAYRMSKAALNALTLMLAHSVRGTNVLVNAVDPGWVRTDMGGAEAPRNVEQGADTIAWLATLGDDGPTGGFFLDRQRIEW